MWLFVFTILLGAAAIAYFVKMYDYAERNNGYLKKKQRLIPTAISTIYHILGLRSSNRSKMLIIPLLRF
ncbi:MAG: hypothetical protein V7K89_15835 [Nostoc sp.]|uniref:hypothetical protein n=1 Tax=Nostoc sp. TaxID=1180 RepID=UPI002FF6BE53